MSHLRPCLSLLTACLLLLQWFAPTAQAAETPFSDVPSDHWAAEAITRSVDLGIFQATADNTFHPSNPITRAAFVVAMNRLFGWESISPAIASFSDVQNSLWYYSAVETAVAYGAITDQVPLFRPNENITREEIGVMLVRALGYTSIAGLAQDPELPFTDISSNPGYLTMACQLGILNGKTDTTLEPNAPASRAEAAVILLRVYDKLHDSSPTLSGIVSGTPNGMNLYGSQTAIVPAYQVTWNGKGASISTALTAAASKTFRTRIQSTGAKALMGAVGTEAALAANDLPALGEQLAEAAADYDGLYLDLAKVRLQWKPKLTELVTAIRSNLQKGQLLYVVVEAPSRRGTVYSGYDFSALSKQADVLALRVAAYYDRMGDVLYAPPEPLEEVYYALAQLSKTLRPDQLALLLTTTGSDGSNGKTIAALLADPANTAYRSDRYEAAYLSVAGQELLWYNDAEAASAKARLCAFFGVQQIILSDLGALADTGTASPLNGLLSSADAAA